MADSGSHADKTPGQFGCTSVSRRLPCTLPIARRVGHCKLQQHRSNIAATLQGICKDRSGQSGILYRVRLLSWPDLWRRRGEAAMNTPETDCPLWQKQRQRPISGARARRCMSGRRLGWRRLWWCACCLPLSRKRRHRSPPRLETVWDVHHKQAIQLATADCLDQLIQERPSLRMTIYTSLWL